MSCAYRCGTNEVPARHVSNRDVCVVPALERVTTGIASTGDWLVTPMILNVVKQLLARLRVAMAWQKNAMRTTYIQFFRSETRLHAQFCHSIFGVAFFFELPSFDCFTS